MCESHLRGELINYWLSLQKSKLFDIGDKNHSQLLSFDIVQELNKSLEKWTDVKKQRDSDIRCITMMIANFLLEFSEHQVSSLQLLRQSIDTKELEKINANIYDQATPMKTTENFKNYLKLPTISDAFIQKTIHNDNDNDFSDKNMASSIFNFFLSPFYNHLFRLQQIYINIGDGYGLIFL
jgi:hypothetical protein